MKKTILKAVGYSLFFLLAVVVFMYWTFPMDKVRHWVEQKALEKGHLDLTIGELDLAGLGGVEASEVVLRLPVKAEEEAEADAPGPPGAPASDADDADEEDDRPQFHVVRLTHLEAHVSLWDLLFHDLVDAHADIEALGGNMQGIHVRSDEGQTRWKVAIEKLEGLRLALLPLEAWLGTDLKAILDGTISAELGKNVWESQGVADLELKDVLLPAPSIDTTLYGQTQTFVLSDIDLGTVKLDLTLDRKGNIPVLGAKSTDRTTVIHFATVQASGGDIEFGLDDSSTLTWSKGQPLKNAYMNIHGSFHIKPTFFEREVEKDGETEKPNLFLRTLLQGDRKWRAAERGGLYGFRCVGPLSPKSCSPTKPPGRGRYTPRARKKAVGRDAPDRKSPATPPDEARTGRPRPSTTRVAAEPDESLDREDRAAARRIRMLGDRDRDRSRPGFIRDRKPTRGRDRTRYDGREEREQKTIPVELPDHPQLDELDRGVEEEPLDEDLPPEDELVPLDEDIPLDEDLPPEDGELVPEDELAPLDEDLPPEEGELPPDEEPLPEEDLPPGEDY